MVIIVIVKMIKLLEVIIGGLNWTLLKFGIGTSAISSGNFSCACFGKISGLFSGILFGSTFGTLFGKFSVGFSSAMILCTFLFPPDRMKT